MCNEAFEEEPYMLESVPDQYITQEMCNEIMHIWSQPIFLIPNRLKHKRCAISQCGNNLFRDVCSRLVCDTTTASKIMAWWRWWWSYCGTMVIKIAMSRKQKRVNAYCLASIKMVELVCSWRREKRDRKIVEVICWCGLVKVSDGLFLSIKFSKNFSKMY